MGVKNLRFASKMTPESAIRAESCQDALLSLGPKNACFKGFSPS